MFIRSLEGIMIVMYYGLRLSEPYNDGGCRMYHAAVGRWVLDTGNKIAAIDSCSEFKSIRTKYFYSSISQRVACYVLPLFARDYVGRRSGAL